MIMQSDKDNEKILIFHFYSGHGVLTEGMQALLLNEYDYKTKHLKMFNAEEKIRTLGELFPNTYHISLFSCERDKQQIKYDYISFEEAKKEYCANNNLEYVKPVEEKKQKVLK